MFKRKIFHLIFTAVLLLNTFAFQTTSFANLAEETEAYVRFDNGIQMKNISDIFMDNKNDMTITTFSGKEVYRIKTGAASSAFVYIDLADKMGNSAEDGSEYEVNIRYYNHDKGYFVLWYDSIDYGKQIAETVYVSNTGEWSNALVTLKDANFKKGVDQKGDLMISLREKGTKLTNSPSDIIIGSITVTRKPSKNPVLVSPETDVSGNTFEYYRDDKTVHNKFTNTTKNNIEAKVKNREDSIKKISIIDELGASLSYNMAAKRQPWSNLSTRIRLKWGKTTFNMNAVFQTYAYEFDKNGNDVVGDRTEWSYGRWGRFQGMSKNLSYTFNNQSFRKIKNQILRLFGHEEDIEEEEETEDSNEGTSNIDDLETNIDDPNSDTKKKGDSENGLDEDGYMKFKMPWSFSISYGITMAEDRTKEINVKNMRYPYKFTQNLNFSGNLKLASSWNCSFSSGWDFTNKAISMTTVNISRDMHCFNISCGLVFGTYTSYHISLRANASTLTDALKYDKKSSYSSSIQWY